MSNIITGKVCKGRGLGRKLGFPTINIFYDGSERGVFAGEVFLKGEWNEAAIHAGEKPTLGDKKVTLEAYLLDFEGEVKVGEEIKVKLLKKIRDTEKFFDLEELKEHIQDDIIEIKNYFLKLK